MHLLPRPAAVGVAALLGLAAQVAADDLFGITVTSPTADDISVTASSIFDLAEDVIQQQNDFARFEGEEFTATLDYANLTGAIVIEGDANAESVRVQIPSIGFDRVFTDEDEAEEFLRNEGADTVASFIRVVNEQTLVGVTDGNPAALTALLADDAFRNFGGFRNPFAAYVQGGDASRLYFQAGAIRTDAGDGTLYEGALASGVRFTDRVGLTLSVPGGFREIEGSQTFYLGAQLGLPIQITPDVSESQPLLWQVTPYALAAGGGSQDQLAGGLILGGGVVNMVGVQLGPVFVHSSQQVVGYGGTPIEAGDFRFETDVEQTLARVSLVATLADDASPVYLQGGVSYTDFLDEAAVDNYISPLLAVGLNIGGDNVLRIGYRGDFADGFDIHRGEAELRFSF
jgi:hypothetical protein